MSGNPEELLRGALEKIVYFECRLSQLEGELAAAREIASREKEGAGSARAREAAASAELGRLRDELDGARRREQDLAERVRLLEGERERFLTGLIDQARIAGAPSTGEAHGEEADLAGFIAEMRAEIERLRPWQAAAQAAGLRVEGPIASPAPQRAAAVEEIAQGFEAAGRIGLGRAETSRMQQGLESRAERSLYEASMDDLASADPRARRRAADALRAMASRNAAPLVAAAVGRERDAEVKVALLSALGALAGPAAVDVAARELSDPRPGVRAAALEAVAALAKDAAEPRLLAALGDASALVRRRAVLLLGFAPGAGTEDALRASLSDRDAGVARAAALGLSGRPTSTAQAALARALDHADESVRKVAATAVARWSGESVASAGPPEDRRRAARRIAEKLAAVGSATLRDAVVLAGPEAAPQARAVAPATAPAKAPTAAPQPASAPAPVRAPIAAPALSAAAAAPRAAVAVAEAPSGDLDPVEEAVLLEIRSALRGRTQEELSRVLPVGSERAIATLLARGAVVQRGPRYFPA